MRSVGYALRTPDAAAPRLTASVTSVTPSSPRAPGSPGRGSTAAREQQEPLDADYIVVEEDAAPLLSPRPRRKRPSAPPAAIRGLVSLARSRPGWRTARQLAALRAYEPYGERLGLLLDIWA